MKQAKVIPLEGELLRFHVYSRSRKGIKHLVDLGEHEENGQCGCEHFQNIGLAIILASVRNGFTKRCWHIDVAREHFCNEMIRAMKRKEEGKL